jgi:predicted  nucleic acid-binding Zn-ribbon protein
MPLQRYDEVLHNAAMERQRDREAEHRRLDQAVAHTRDQLRVRRVVIARDGFYEVLNIERIEHSDDGVTVFVR